MLLAALVVVVAAAAWRADRDAARAADGHREAMRWLSQGFERLSAERQVGTEATLARALVTLSEHVQGGHGDLAEKLVEFTEDGRRSQEIRLENERLQAAQQQARAEIARIEHLMGVPPRAGAGPRADAAGGDERVEVDMRRVGGPE